ncbi:hypothetical protein CU044_3956 [Streptomyces sp. L-9-10]|nr:hypothetical protein CU044_3956 [Streptomyces sp. L-9-10]
MLGADAESQIAEFTRGKAQGSGAVGGGRAAGAAGQGRYWLLVNGATMRAVGL